MRNRWRWWLLAAAAIAAATGIASYHADRGAPPPHGSSRLVIYQSWVGGALYAEGSRSYLAIAAKSGGRDRFGYVAGDSNDPVYSKRLAAGTYTLRSWQRPCDGNCGFLDAPTERCRRTITLDPRTSAAYTIELTPGRGCRIVPGTPTA